MRSGGAGTYTLRLDREYQLTRIGLSLRNGRAASARVYASTDGVTWGDPIVTANGRTHPVAMPNAFLFGLQGRTSAGATVDAYHFAVRADGSLARYDGSAWRSITGAPPVCRRRYSRLMGEPAFGVVLPFRTIDSLVRPRRDVPEGLHVVRDADEWTRHWAGSSAGRPAGPPVPAVDWQTEMCVVAALGTCPNGGYSVLIDVIVVVGDRMRVLVWEIRPGPDCATTRDITHPFRAVAAPAHAGTAELVKRIAYEDCEATGR